MPNVFRCPSEAIPETQGLTTYQVIVGPHSLFTGQRSCVPLRAVTDGTPNTFLVVEGARPEPWSQPTGLPLDSGEPLLGMGSKHPGGFNASFGDGSVRFIKRSINPQTLRALATRDGGEVVSAAEY
jgi:prepilin-type processing-associated H-X9-DG protein